MRKTGLLLLVLIFTVGCQNGLKTNHDPVKVTLVGTDTFPPQLAGTWSATDGSGWQFTFNDSGEITSFVIEFGKIKLIPGQTARFPTRYGGKGIFEPGPCLVIYDAGQNMLSVELEIKDFYQDIGKDSLKGSIYYMLPGLLSEDRSQWVVDWSVIYKITALMPNPVVLEDMKEPEYKGSVVFEKIESEDI